MDRRDNNADAESENSRGKIKERYDHSMICPNCNKAMQYIFGEKFLCEDCGYIGFSDFGKIREFIEDNGPQPAVIISENTGVSLNYINELLLQGRIEIPDGSEVYIQCQKCGADIRYGRYCPECMMKLTNSIGGAMSNAEVGERPKHKKSEGMYYRKSDVFH